MNTENGICIIAYRSLYENTSYVLFNGKWLDILVGALKRGRWTTSITGKYKQAYLLKQIHAIEILPIQITAV